MVYKELQTALNERKRIEKKNSRLLMAFDEEDYLDEYFDEDFEFELRNLNEETEEPDILEGPQIDVPYDFIEAFLPIGGLFALLEAFFGALKSLQNTYNPR